MFRTRLISGIILVVVALLAIMTGSYVLLFTLMGISVIGMQELYKAILQDKKRAGDTLRFVLPETIGKARIWEESVTA